MLTATYAVLSENRDEDGQADLDEALGFEMEEEEPEPVVRDRETLAQLATFGSVETVA